MLSILCRSDCHVFNLVFDSDAPTAANLAAQLSEGQCFEVVVVAMMQVNKFQQEQFLEAMTQHHTVNNWFAVELDQLLSLWLGCIDLEEELGKVSDSQRQQPPPNLTPSEETISQDNELPGCLSYCIAAEAPHCSNNSQNPY